MLYMLLKRFAVGPLVNWVYRPEAEGLEHIPAHGAAILASNHLSFSDSVFMPVAVDRQVYFLAKAEYFSGRGVRGRLTAAFFRAINQIPMDRSGGKKSQASLSAAARTLQKNGVLGIYPEGTRSPDGRLYRAKLGVARLALETRAPVIPIAMVNTEKVQPKGTKIPKRRAQGRRIAPVRTIVGPALDLSRYYEQPRSRAVEREIADEIMRAIQQLSGQEYVDLYAADVKSLMEKQRIADAKAAAQQLLDRARDRAQASMDSARESMGQARETVEQAFEDARQKVEDRFGR